MGGRLSEKVALVLDVGGPVGSVIARRFVEEGARVFGVYLLDSSETGRPTDRPREGAAKLEGAADADIRDPKSVEAALEQALGGRPVDVATNAFARHGFGPIDDVDDTVWLEEMEWNLGMTFRMVRSVAGSMKERGAGSIVTVSSTAKDGVPWFSHMGHATHAAARGGILGLTRSLAYELGRFNVRVNCVVPGPVKPPGTVTAFDRLDDDPSAAVLPDQTFALRRYGSPQDVANAVLFFASDEAGYITGQNLYVSGGLYY